MSWSNPIFDIFKPSLNAKLTTKDMIYERKLSSLFDDKKSIGGYRDKKNIGVYSNNSEEDIKVGGGSYCCVGDTICTGTHCIYVCSVKCDDDETCKKDSCWSCLWCKEGICDKSAKGLCYSSTDFSGLKTCSIGEIGICKENCKIKDNWNWNRDKNGSGWVNCVYMYDFTNYNIYDINNSGPSNLAKQLTKLITGKTTSIPDGLDPTYKNRVRDSHFIFACIFEFYNQIYNTGYWEKNVETNPFYSVDYLSDGIDETTENIAAYTEIPFAILYENNNIPESLKRSVKSVQNFPKPEQNGDIYTMLLSLSYYQWLEYSKAKDPSGFISNFINSILSDRDSNINDGTKSWSPNGPSLKNATIIDVTAINTKDYSIKTGIIYKDFTVKNYSDYIFATIQIRIEIDTWSPMLIAFFQAFNPIISYSLDNCTKIANQQSPYPGPIPKYCFSLICDSSDESCKSAIQTYCNMSYTPPDFTTRLTTEDLLTTSHSKQCYCYNSLLAPIGAGNDNSAAMCFDKNCSKKMRDLFGLTDDICKTNCGRIGSWLINQGDPGTGSENSENVDNLRLRNMCGDDSKAHAQKTFNKSVFNTCSIGILLGTILTYLLCKSGPLNFSSSGTGFAKQIKTIIITLCVFAILTSISIYLGKDMAGKSYCLSETKKFRCESRLSKKPIPDEFCTYTLPCECIFDKDCGSCICSSSACVPLSGNRPTKVVTVKKTSILTIVSSVIILLLLPLVIFFGNRQYKVMPNYIVYILSGLIVISCVIYIVKSKDKKVKQTVFASPECCSPVCDNKECGNDGCGGSCGVCTGQECFVWKIFKPSTKKIPTDVLGKVKDAMPVCAKQNSSSPFYTGYVNIDIKSQNYGKFLGYDLEGNEHGFKTDEMYYLSASSCDTINYTDNIDNSLHFNGIYICYDAVNGTFTPFNSETGTCYTWLGESKLVKAYLNNICQDGNCI